MRDRDSALVFTMLVDEYINGDESIQYLIEDCEQVKLLPFRSTLLQYSDIDAQAILQTVTNPSGTLYPAGLGLGEPKAWQFKGTLGLD
jgi:glucoamylase